VVFVEGPHETSVSVKWRVHGYDLLYKLFETKEISMHFSIQARALILSSSFQVRMDSLGVLIGLMILSALAATSLGLAFGTAVKPEQI
jgi:hypothetical protein